MLTALTSSPRGSRAAAGGSHRCIIIHPQDCAQMNCVSNGGLRGHRIIYASDETVNERASMCLFTHPEFMLVKVCLGPRVGAVPQVSEGREAHRAWLCVLREWSKHFSLTKKQSLTLFDHWSIFIACRLSTSWKIDKRQNKRSPSRLVPFWRRSKFTVPLWM